MEIPDHTDILGMDVRTVYDDPTLGEETFGFCDFEHSLILLKNKMGNMSVSPQQKEESYLHEILHHIDSALVLNIKETQITRLSAGLYQVLHTNKLAF